MKNNHLAQHQTKLSEGQQLQNSVSNFVLNERSVKSFSKREKKSFLERHILLVTHLLISLLLFSSMFQGWSVPRQHDLKWVEAPHRALKHDNTTRYLRS